VLRGAYKEPGETAKCVKIGFEPYQTGEKQKKKVLFERTTVLNGGT